MKKAHFLHSSFLFHFRAPFCRIARLLQHLRKRKAFQRFLSKMLSSNHQILVQFNVLLDDTLSAQEHIRSLYREGKFRLRLLAEPQSAYCRPSPSPHSFPPSAARPVSDHLLCFHITIKLQGNQAKPLNGL